MSEESKTPRVFISYARDDNDIAYYVAGTLLDTGYQVLSGEEFYFGDMMREELYSRIEHCDVLVVLLTEKTDSSDWVRREVDYARDAKVVILPLLAWDKISLHDADDVVTALDLKATHYLVFSDEDPWQKDRLIQTVKKLTDISRADREKDKQLERAKIEKQERERLEKVYREQSEREIGRIISEAMRAIENQKEMEEGIKVKPVFGTASADDDFKCHVFMIMPFAEEFNSIYQDYVKPTVEDLGLTIKRGDDFFSHHDIIDEVWSAIYASQIVIADCTGRNPNVFYELGIAHTLGKIAILITQNIDDTPFDVQGKRFIVYKDNSAGLKLLREKLKEYVSKAAKK